MAAADEVTGAEAEAEARRTGVPVEITTERRQRSTFFANPDGTRRVDISAMPVRTRRNGGWVEVDTSLAVGADGRVAPVAAARPMSFSAGGTDALAEFTADGVELGVSFPAGLPEPVLEGSTATYAEVFPGVDLVVHAQVEGFSHVLVVKDRTAAQNPALRELRMSLAAPGATVSQAEGGLVVRGKTGRRVMRGQPPVMWDSRGERGAEVAKQRRAQPQRGDGVGRMGLELDAGVMVLRPNLDLLTGPDTVFPVYLDPWFGKSAPEDGAWAMVFQQYPGMEFFKWTGSQGVGHQTYNGVSTKRLFWRFATWPIRGTEILDAKFKAYETHSASCTPTRLNLYRTGLIDNGTNWSNQPGWWRYISSRTVAFGRSGCDPDGRWVEFDATLAAELVADQKATQIGLGLRAHDESDSLSWKRFRNDVVFSVAYNTPPGKPTNLQTVNPGTRCVTGADRPVISLMGSNWDAATLSAELHDADDHGVRGIFELYEGTLSGGTRIWRRYVPPVDADGNPQYRLPGTFTRAVAKSILADDRVYTWRVRTRDRYGGVGPWSRACEFRADGQAPAPPVIDAPETGVQGQTVEVRFTSSTDAERFEWSVNTDGMDRQVDVSDGSGTATVDVPLPASGPVTIYATAHDAVNGTTRNEETFTVACDGNGDGTTGDCEAVVRFAMNEGSGGTTEDVVDATRHLTLPTGAEWVMRDDWLAIPAVWFDGTGPATSNAAGMVTTDQNFSIGAWVRPDDAAADGVVVSQGGPSGAVFELAVSHTCGASGPAACWVFRVRDIDGTVVEVATGLAPRWGAWQHVMGVYDAANDDLHLWVDATDQSTYEPDDGDLEVPASGGDLSVAGTTASGFTGAVDEVVAYAGALNRDQVFTAKKAS